MKNDYSDGILFSVNKEYTANQFQFENITLYQAGENVIEDGGEIFSHTQECNEISYIISGSADVWSDDVKHTLRKGDVHVISKGHVHKIVANQSERVRYVFLGFDFSLGNGNDYYVELVDYYNKIGFDVRKDKGNILAIFNLLMNELCEFGEDNNSLSTEVFKVFIKALLISVYRLRETPGAVLATGYINENRYVSGTVFNIAKFVDANPASIERVSDIASAFNYSLSYISRIFKEKMGITLREYIYIKKIEASHELLRSNKYSVTEIADYLHFNSYRSFYRNFTHVTGMSPTQFIEFNVNKKE